MTRTAISLAIAGSLLLSACSDPPDAEVLNSEATAVTQRLDAIEASVTQWRSAETLAEAKAGAEAARNFVVGPTGPGYGDGDGDGTIRGENEGGLLPGLTLEGLAQLSSVSPCAVADVLGGSWSDPAARWATAQDAYDAWTPSNNTMPTLPSHPQRIVGWATFTLALDGAATDSLDDAHEYAGHAQLHVDVSRAALEPCLD